MTREEASFILANIDRRVCDNELNDALDMAIKTLEQEPCEDCISRQSALEIIKSHVLTNDYAAIEALPPVTPQPKTDIAKIEEDIQDYKDTFRSRGKTVDEALDDVLDIIDKYTFHSSGIKMEV